MAATEYARSIEAWRTALELDLRREDGLLALCGIFWLQEGINTIGSSADCAMRLPKPMPRLLGALELAGERVRFTADVGQAVDVDGQPGQTSVELSPGGKRGRTILHIGEFSLALIDYAGRFGLQAWNAAGSLPPENTLRRWFDIDERFRTEGAYTGYPVPVKVRIPDSLGEVREGYAQGYVRFKLHGKSFSLEATETPEGRLFLQFRDLTNGGETYEGGRYLESGPVSESGAVILDFNRATNPPSAFTAYAPCPLAPATGALECRVAAGELRPFTGARSS